MRLQGRVDVADGLQFGPKSSTAELEGGGGARAACGTRRQINCVAEIN